MTVWIPLRSRDSAVVDFALIDDDDCDRVGQHIWYRMPIGYAGHGIWIDDNSRRTIEYMHRFVMHLERGDRRQCDHINHDKLDNRKANIRVCTMLENGQNRSGAYQTAKASSGHRGVSWDAARQKWVGQVMINYKRVFGKRFDTEEEAVLAVREFRRSNMPFSDMDAR